ncbi:methyltransferase domain-containing protein [Spongiibacter sp. KMU-158]|uniref:Methyltransferase domain-containing protein n=1 Tax=Spongiibacter pelagi TaxID=2760804 RepID=A0A927GXL1_9GAMM|nr:class I SAM-dependent methyltransferase [Spongiibacter pelagi]MBD2860117.1 methyltransferase domain-containing protein [Spongiibacter pelagi]
MSNREQKEYWNGDAGQHWATQDELMATLLKPIAEGLLEHINPQAGQSALDIGCGGGSQSLLLAERLGKNGKVVGLDISEPLLHVARTRPASADSAELDFIQADAQEYAFEPAQFDLLFSRFGVMFFDEPETAFRNLRTALKPDGKLGFSCWPSPKANPFFSAPLAAVLKHVPAPEASDPNAPGPFAFADPARLTGILDAAGFGQIVIEEFTTTLKMGEDDTLDNLTAAMSKIGPASRLLKEHSEEIKAAAHGSIMEALAPYFQDGSLHFPTRIWFVTAHNEA